jgi:glucose/sorbosone dehydrogenase/chitobiase/beta-hexosaminidase-like protein
MNSRRTTVCFLLSTLLLTIALRADAQVDWPQVKLTQVAEGLTFPTHINSARDGSGRLFITEQPGRIQILQSNSPTPQLFLDISDRVLFDLYWGLLSVEFPTNFASKGYFYVYYTSTNDHATVISRFFVSSTNANQADPLSEQKLLVVTNRPCPTLPGGLVKFGPDGYLYIGMGSDEICAETNLAQMTDSYWGKILRIDVESSTNGYAVPASNPFVGNSAYRPEIWALGFRNPWRFSFDRLNGDLYIADVGQNFWEEIDFQPAGDPGGQNYGWNIMEGTFDYDRPPGYDISGLTPPVAQYEHSIGQGYGSSITGGFVYRGTNTTGRMTGIYFFGDFYFDKMWGMARVGTNWILQTMPATLSFASSFGEDETGELFVTDLIFGKIYHIEDSGLTGPPILSPPGGTVPSETILVTSTSPGAVFHYTTNGATPTQLDPMVGSNGTVVVTSGTTLSVRAFRADLQPSTVTVATYVFQAGMPDFAPAHGPITNGTMLTITSATPGATIRYTLNGTNPDLSSPVYSGPVAISPTNIVSARAYKTDFIDSPIRRVYFNGAVNIDPVLISSGWVYMYWQSYVGFTYQVQVSTNLTNWANIGGPYTGNGTQLGYGGPVGSSQQFFRVWTY